MKSKPNLKLVQQRASGLAIQDELNNEIQVALGIQLAVMGQGRLCGFDSSPLSALCDAHIAGLERIAAAVEQGRA